MREIRMPYGRGSMPLHVPEERLMGILYAHHPACGSHDQADLVLQALAAPIGTPRLKDMARGRRRILIITSDHTRPVPSRV